MKIKLFCSAGMSTSIVVKKMQEAAEKRGLEAEIAAYPESTMELETADCDVALLGPQVRFMLDKAKDICRSRGVPVEVIDMRHYGMMNGEAVLDQALKLINET